jgi:hypothetical protein
MPDVSIVIPVYNEEGILREAVTELLDGYDTVRVALDWPELTLEVVIAENGSKDRTVELAEHLANERPEVRTFSLGEPNYGKALKRGISEAKGTWVICEEIDLCDLDFHRRALEHLRHRDADMVVGSKAMKGASDHRPLMRRAATRSPTPSTTASSTRTCSPRSSSCAPGARGRRSSRSRSASSRSGSRRSTSSSACRTSSRTWSA